MAKRKYITINRKDHPRATTSGHVLLHIIVAEQKLGRKLRPGETVHHLDENKMNNAPENLIVFATSGDHTAFHKGSPIYQSGDLWYAEKKKSEKRICQNCGKTFTSCKSQKYCSSICSHASYRKNQLNINDIVKLVRKYNGNFTKAAKEANVTDNALKHRLQYAGLPFHSRDYRNK